MNDKTRGLLLSVIFIPGYWFCISGRGAESFWVLWLGPFVLIAAVGIGALLRQKMKITADLHWVDFVGVVIALIACYFGIPTTT